MYRVGLPLWKWLARLGAPLSVRVIVHYDPEVNSYWTTSPDLKGLVVTGNTFEELRNEVKHAIPDLIELELQSPPPHVSPKFETEPLPA